MDGKLMFGFELTLGLQPIDNFADVCHCGGMTDKKQTAGTVSSRMFFLKNDNGIAPALSIMTLVNPL